MKIVALIITAIFSIPGPVWHVDITPAISADPGFDFQTPMGEANGITLPYVILCHNCPLTHEETHIRQWALFGSWLVPIYSANPAPFESYLSGGMFDPPVSSFTNLYPLVRVSNNGIQVLPGWFTLLP